MKEKIVIFDLDGCISDDRHRSKLLPTVASSQEEFDAYHSMFMLDEPMNRDLVLHYATGEYTIVFLTARPQKYYRGTIAWIGRCFPEVTEFELYMRPDGDHRISPLVKVSQFEEKLGEELWPSVIAAYDDREDVLHVIKSRAPNAKVFKVSYPVDPIEAILEEMSETFLSRNGVYKDNYKRVSLIMAALFPNGVPREALSHPCWHLFEMTIAKLSRFATSEFKHYDSIHDAAVYTVLIQNETKETK